MPDIRILHVDDEPDVRLLVEASLGLDPGLITRNCASGTEALAIAAQWRPDLILLDATMPGMDGPATLAQLKDDPQTSGIRVIFLTASCQDSDIDRFRSIGSAGVIAKPFDPRALAASVRSHAAGPVTPSREAPADAALAEPNRPGHVIGTAGNSMASGLSGATSAGTGDGCAIVLFDANGHPMTLILGDPRGAPGLHAGGSFGMPDWRSSPTLHAAEAGTRLDLDSHHAGLTFAMSEATGAGIGDHASGYHAASDLIQHGAFAWEGGGTTGLVGSDLWGAHPSAAPLHAPKLLG